MQRTERASIIYDLYMQGWTIKEIAEMQYDSASHIKTILGRYQKSLEGTSRDYAHRALAEEIKHQYGSIRKFELFLEDEYPENFKKNGLQRKVKGETKITLDDIFIFTKELDKTFDELFKGEAHAEGTIF